MKRVKLGKTGPLVSKLALGTRKMLASVDGNVTMAEKLLLDAFDQGVDFLMAAGHYADGEAEKLLGKAIAGYRDQVVLASSAGIVKTPDGNVIDISPESLEKQLQSSLDNLQTDHIDLFQLHYMDPFADPAETMKFLQEKQADNVIGAIGISNVNVDDLVDWTGFDICSLQMPYNPLQREIEEHYFSLCRKHDIAILAYAPLLTGVFTEQTLEHGNLSSLEHYLTAEQRERVVKAVDLVAGFSRDHGLRISQAVLAWIAGITDLSAILVGTGSIEHLRENVEAVERGLRREEGKQLAAVLEELGFMFPHGLTYPFEVKEIRTNARGVNYTKLFGIYCRIPPGVKENDMVVINDATGMVVEVIPAES